MSAPEHRGETVSVPVISPPTVWPIVLHGRKGKPQLWMVEEEPNTGSPCFAGTGKFVDLYHIEVVPAAALDAERARACPNPNEHLAGWSAKCDDFMKRAEEAQKAEKVAADSAREWSEKWHGLRKQLLEAQKEVERLREDRQNRHPLKRARVHQENLRLRAALEAAEAKIAAMLAIATRLHNEGCSYCEHGIGKCAGDALAALRDGTK